MDISIFLFDDFQTLDVFGPVEVLGRVEEFNLRYCSFSGGIVKSRHHVPVSTEKLGDTASEDSVLFIPGGMGTRPLVHEEKNQPVIDQLKTEAEKSRYCLTVCTGSALLAKTGLLNHKQATSNKIAWPWVTSINADVLWQYRARWCVDGSFYTSSGVSAGIDMALGFVADLYGTERARAIAKGMEYVWNESPTEDPFAEAIEPPPLKPR